MTLYPRSLHGPEPHPSPGHHPPTALHVEPTLRSRLRVDLAASAGRLNARPTLILAVAVRRTKSAKKIGPTDLVGQRLASALAGRRRIRALVSEGGDSRAPT